MMFSQFEDPAPDTILHLAKLFAADPRPGRIDLGVGVFRDDRGVTPVMRAVKAAELQLQATQASKSYLAPEGDMGFVAALAPIVLGDALAASDRVQGLQTPGGTGALCVALQLVKRANPAARVWLSTPTWANHRPMVVAAGLEPLAHPFFDQGAQALLFDEMLAALRAAHAGDLVLLQACCHNPTGARLDLGQWGAVADLLLETGAVPLIDLAYQGLGDGLDEDAAGARLLLERVPEALLAYSCDKNFGLYRDRVGAVWVQGATAQETGRARGQALAAVRAMWSMPPDHGAAVVRMILENEALRADWRAELDSMCARINSLRQAVAGADPGLAFMGRQTGMFSLLPTTVEQVEALRRDHAIYVVPPGRMNIAGLQMDEVARLVTALGAV